MRTLIGVVADGRVTEMSLPGDVALAYLVPEIEQLLGLADRWVRSVDGAWLDGERSLVSQGYGSGSVVCLELDDRSTSGLGLPHHDLVAVMLERAPPKSLLTGSAAAVVVGGAVGVWLALVVGRGAVLVVAAAPISWIVLPLLAGLATPTTGPPIQTVLVTAAQTVGAMALGAAGVVAMLGPVGVMLDGCVAGGALMHVMRDRVTNPLVRVAFGAVEWWLVGAVAPLAVVVLGRSPW